MPVFEVETPDGVFDVEAPDMQSAISAMGQRQVVPAPTQKDAPLPYGQPPEGMFYDEKSGRMMDGSAIAQRRRDISSVEADKIEAIRSTNSFADASGSALSGIPFGDETVSFFAGPVEAGIDAIKGKGFHPVQAYNKAIGTERELQRRRDERSPIASTVGAIGGGLGVGGVMAKGGATFLNGAKATLPSLVGRGAAEGASYGLVYGAGEGESLKDRANRAVRGATTGAVIGAGTGAFSRLFAKGSPAKSPTVDEIKAASNAAYKAADKAGVIFKKQGMNKLGRDIVDTLRTKAFTPENNPEVVAFLRAMKRDASGNVTLKGLDTLRKTASNGMSGSRDSTKAMLSEIIDKIDDFVDSPGAYNVLTGKSKEASKAISEARALWSRAKKTEAIQEAFMKAERNAAASGSGGNMENAARQQIKSILNSPKKSRGFNKAEIAAMEQFVRGTKGQNLARLVGKLSPQGNGLMAALGIGATAMNPFMAAAPIAGMVAKKVATHGSSANQKMLESLVRNGAALQPAQLSAGRKAIADALMRSGVIASQTNTRP